MFNHIHYVHYVHYIHNFVINDNDNSNDNNNDNNINNSLFLFFQPFNEAITLFELKRTA